MVTLLPWDPHRVAAICCPSACSTPNATIKSLSSVIPFVLSAVCGLLNIASGVLASPGVPDSVSLAVIGLVMVLAIASGVVWYRRRGRRSGTAADDE